MESSALAMLVTSPKSSTANRNPAASRPAENNFAGTLGGERRRQAASEKSRVTSAVSRDNDDYDADKQRVAGSDQRESEVASAEKTAPEKAEKVESEELRTAEKSERKSEKKSATTADDGDDKELSAENPALPVDGLPSEERLARIRDDLAWLQALFAELELAEAALEPNLAGSAAESADSGAVSGGNWLAAGAGFEFILENGLSEDNPELLAKLAAFRRGELPSADFAAALRELAGPGKDTAFQSALPEGLKSGESLKEAIFSPSDTSIFNEDELAKIKAAAAELLAKEKGGDSASQSQDFNGSAGSAEKLLAGRDANPEVRAGMAVFLAGGAEKSADNDAALARAARNMTSEAGDAQANPAENKQSNVAAGAQLQSKQERKLNDADRDPGRFSSRAQTQSAANQEKSAVAVSKLDLPADAEISVRREFMAQSSQTVSEQGRKADSAFPAASGSVENRSDGRADITADLVKTGFNDNLKTAMWVEEKNLQTETPIVGKVSQSESQAVFQLHKAVGKNFQDLDGNSLAQSGQKNPVSDRSANSIQAKNLTRLPVSDDSLIEQIKNALPSRPQARQTVTIKLWPESMGKVDVKLTLNHNNQLSASFVVEQSEVKEAMLRKLDGLKEGLTLRGIEVKDVDIKVAATAKNGDGPGFNLDTQERNSNGLWQNARQQGFADSRGRNRANDHGVESGETEAGYEYGPLAPAPGLTGTAASWSIQA